MKNGFAEGQFVLSQHGRLIIHGVDLVPIPSTSTSLGDWMDAYVVPSPHIVVTLSNVPDVGVLASARMLSGNASLALFNLPRRVGERTFHIWQLPDGSSRFEQDRPFTPNDGMPYRLLCATLTHQAPAKSVLLFEDCGDACCTPSHWLENPVIVLGCNSTIDRWIARMQSVATADDLYYYAVIRNDKDNPMQGVVYWQGVLSKSGWLDMGEAWPTQQL